MCESQLRQNNWKKTESSKLDSSIDCPKQWEGEIRFLFSFNILETTLLVPALESASALAPSPTEMAVPTCVLGNTEDVRVGHQFSCYHVKWCEVLMGHIGQKKGFLRVFSHTSSFVWGLHHLLMRREDNEDEAYTSWDDVSDGLWQCYWQCYTAMHIWQEKLAWFDMICLASLNSKTEAWNARFLPPKKLTWQWNIHHAWRCISSSKWKFSSLPWKFSAVYGSNSMVLFVALGLKARHFVMTTGRNGSSCYGGSFGWPPDCVCHDAVM